MALNIESCSREEACLSLGGNEKLLDELLDRLQDWLKLQPHLPQDIPKRMLEHFILGTKMSLERAKHKVDMFYTMKRLVPEIFADRDPRGPDFTYLHGFAEIVYLPKLTPQKYRVLIVRLCGDDYKKHVGYDGYKYVLMIEELLINQCRSLGNIYIMDHSQATFGLAAKYTPTLLKKTEVVMREGYAKRIKGIHFINAAPITEAFVGFVKKVSNPKIASRIYAHPKGDYESLYQHVPKSVLPKDYGGEERSMTQLAGLWRQKVDDERDWFLEQEKLMVDERLRPGPAIDGDDLFGFSGSFRKLDLD